MTYAEININRWITPDNPEVKRLASQLKTPEAMYNYVRDKITYVSEKRNYDYWQIPEGTILNKTGDCEDKSFLLASLLLAEGFDCKVIFSDIHGYGGHAYNESELNNGKTLKMDTTCTGCDFTTFPNVTEDRIAILTVNSMIILNDRLFDKYLGGRHNI